MNKKGAKMSPGEVLDISREALIVLLKVSAPLLIVGLVIGLSISFLQALTQIQEATLVFVPKVIFIFITLMITLPYMGQTLRGFTEHLFDKMVALT
ncbi:MAG: flagellar biosynthesis protein FliQ [Janthinobacterium lividum]